MKRLLFIGNSHLAALKGAWDAQPSTGYEAEFFGAPQRAYQRMSLLTDTTFGLDEGGDFGRQRKITMQANGKPAVSLTDRDVVILVGSFSAAEAIATVLATCDVTGMREIGAATLLSGVLYDAACAALALDLLPEPGWHNRTDVKVVLMPRPATNESCLTSTYAGFQPWHRIAAAPSGVQDGFARFDAALGLAMADQSLAYLPQPIQTRTAAGLTALNFLAEGGGTVPGEEQRRGDHAHMNNHYGAACLNQLLGWLDTRPHHPT